MKLLPLIAVSLLMAGCTVTLDIKKAPKVDVERKELVAALKQRDGVLAKLAERLHVLEGLQNAKKDSK